MAQTRIAEHQDMAIKGKPKRKRANIHQLIFTPIREHSQKPDLVRNKIIQLCGDLPRIELFARKKAYGWDAWGNEVEEVQTLEQITKFQ